jgi:hypothetical protein
MDDRHNSPLYIYLMTRNRLLYLKKRGKPWYALMVLILTSEFKSLISLMLKKNAKDKNVRIRYRIMGIRDFLIGRYGKPIFIS